MNTNDEEEEEDFNDADAWLDTDWPIDDEEEEARIEKLRRLRNPWPTIVRVHPPDGGEPVDVEVKLLLSGLEVVTVGDEQVVRLIKYPDVVGWRGQGRVELIDNSNAPRQLIQPTVIRYPNEDPGLPTVEVVVPGSVDDYTLDRWGDLWIVTANPTKAQIYSGPGPVEIIQAPPPF